MMKKIAVIIAVLALFLMGGATAVATHTAVTEEHEVPFTVGGVTGTVTITDTDALPHETVTDVFTVTDTVTDTVTTTVTETVTNPNPPPPPPPPPPSGGGCTIHDTSGCVPASTIIVANQYWRCTRPLSTYGALPLRVISHPVGQFQPAQGGAPIQLGNGCTGDTDPESVDLILDVRGDGRTFGSGEDAVRLMNASPGPTNIQITGRADCGPRTAGAHADGIQAISGQDITFVDFNIGNYDAGLSTCQGAGGTVFYSGAGSNRPINLKILRGKYIGCNHSLNNGNPPNLTGYVRDAFFRSGRNDGSDPVCNYFSSQPCDIDPSIRGTFEFVGNVCQRWNGSTFVDQ